MLREGGGRVLLISNVELLHSDEIRLADFEEEAEALRCKHQRALVGAFALVHYFASGGRFLGHHCLARRQRHQKLTDFGRRLVPALQSLDEAAVVKGKAGVEVDVGALHTLQTNVFGDNFFGVFSRGAGARSAFSSSQSNLRGAITVNTASDCAFSKFHLISRERASFVAENVLNLPQFFV